MGLFTSKQEKERIEKKRLEIEMSAQKERDRKEALLEEEHKTKMLKLELERKKMKREEELEESQKEAQKKLNTLKIEGIKEENIGKLVAYLAMTGDEKSKDVLIGTIKNQSEKLLENTKLVQENAKLLKEVDLKSKEIEELTEKSQKVNKLKDFENQILNIKANPSLSDDTKDQLLQKLYNENPDYFEEIQKIVGKINAN